MQYPMHQSRLQPALSSQRGVFSLAREGPEGEDGDRRTVWALEPRARGMSRIPSSACPQRE
ncbi:MAG: hypothetical protein KatS3mg059_0854 [Thermomicrobiales bacterium]|nr:MAG: hypothetical protein KatS3mg059_0854 [Thermomicrobiales bacterium]